MSQISKSRVVYTNSCRCATLLYGSLQAYRCACVTSHIRMCRFIQIKQSCHAYALMEMYYNGSLQVFRRSVRHMNVSFCTYKRVVSHVQVRVDAHELRVTRLFHKSHTYKWSCRRATMLDHELQPIADRVAQHLEINSKNYQFSTRCTRILMGFIIYYLVLIVNPWAEFWFVGKVFEKISRCCATLSAIGCTCDTTLS